MHKLTINGAIPFASGGWPDAQSIAVSDENDGEV